jgi:hypothetical protein
MTELEVRKFANTTSEEGIVVSDCSDEELKQIEELNLKLLSEIFRGGGLI